LSRRPKEKGFANRLAADEASKTTYGCSLEVTEVEMGEEA
jgi:hypothetical protein